MNEQLQNIFGMSLTELEEACSHAGIEKFRAIQMFYWLYGNPVTSFEEMTNLGKGLRAELGSRYIIRHPEVEHCSQSADGTRKYLFALYDGAHIEAVLIPSEPADEDEETVRRMTLCVSTQVGCPLDCKFCATGSMKLLRNLTAGETVGQFVAVQSETAERITNLVYMGMGEPLLNYDAVMQSIDIVTHEKAAAMSPNRITVSTAGIVPAIKRMADEGRKNKLAVSLHSCDNETRTRLMPVTKKYNLASVVSAAEYYYKKTRRRITYEYILFDGVNDGADDIRDLIKLTRRIPAKVNIIPFHSVLSAFPKGVPLGLRAAPQERMEQFAAELRAAGVTVMFRSSSGKDIDAACGQLAIRAGLEKKVPPGESSQN